MNDYDLPDRLLPSNAGACQKAFVAAMDKVLATIQPPYPSLLSAHETPYQMLPYLAQDKTVSDWVVGDSGVQRKLVAERIRALQVGGTPSSIVVALGRLGISSKLIERDGFKFSIDVTYSDAFTGSFQAFVANTVNEYKPAGSEFTLSLIRAQSFVYRVDLGFRPVVYRSFVLEQ